jgi:hypothetical protein
MIAFTFVFGTTTEPGPPDFSTGTARQPAKRTSAQTLRKGNKRFIARDLPESPHEHKPWQARAGKALPGFFVAR